MAEPKTVPYGSWPSPITAELVSGGGGGAVRLVEVALDGGDVYWVEARPAEGGRYAVVRRADTDVADITPPGFSARTRVHEYGGGAFTVCQRTLYFANNADQQLYRLAPGGEPVALTAAPSCRFADPVVDRLRGRLICVREDHGTGGAEPVNAIVAVDLGGAGPGGAGAGALLVSGSDFYASPRLSPDGGRLAWLSWDHPNMPWDGCALWCAEVRGDGAPGEARLVAGGPEESVFQPAWSPDGVLHFASDRTGWWNLYRWRGDGAEALCPMEAEFGRAQWIFGMSTYGFEGAGRIVCAHKREGRWRLARLDSESGRLVAFGAPEGYSEIESLHVDGGRAVMIASTPREAPAVVSLDPASGEREVLRRSVALDVDPEYLSEPEAITFPTEDGLTAHAFYYPPRNPDFAAPAGALPPLLVKSHGGPTSAATDELRLAVQFWTSRGFAVLDVNYGGSTGYGRDYRRRLDGRWGVVDLDDCVNGARHLVGSGLVDGERLAISGGSAGGYTTLCALTFRDLFKAGASHYGIGDLEALARDTHKFESRYLDRMIGPYPERADLYRERSPIHFTERLSCPVIFFQGLEDEVVPPAQAEAMVEALRGKGLPVAYVPFAGEQHGFRRAETIKRALEAELYFYARIFGFEPADTIEPVTIENL